MKNIYILHNKFLDNLGEKFSIGGVETYILNLAKLFMTSNYNVKIYQFSKFNFTREYDGLKIIGLKVSQKKFESDKKKLYKFLINNEKINYKDDVLIFGSDYMIVKNDFCNSIAIQHGIAWDILSYKNEKNISNIFSIFLKMLGSIKKYIRYSKVNEIVAVDYNFLNWYRTQIKNINNKIMVIPNFVKNIVVRKDYSCECIKIIFARRFVEYRGTRLFTNAIEKILKLNLYNLKITIAGEGPEAIFMHNKLDCFKNVKFIKYNPDDSYEIHKNNDIAVVPTLGSEGTSLSLLEAMGAGCAVIASNIGGMTNIIIDHYNGLLIEPNEDSLVNSLLLLTNDYELRKKLGLNASMTTNESFNKSNWDKKWLDVLNFRR